MKDNEVQRLVDLRSFLIHRYNNLDGGQNPGTAVILQKEVAYILENAIKDIDGLLENYVKIRKK
tara:strand:+ start:199 stop:390 length:192 start_codon:yes stop_codon:yes gene_type:complete